MNYVYNFLIFLRSIIIRLNFPPPVLEQFNLAQKLSAAKAGKNSRHTKQITQITKIYLIITYSSYQ